MADPTSSLRWSAQEVLELASELCAGFSIERREITLADHFIRVLQPRLPGCQLAVRLLHGTPPRIKAVVTSEGDDSGVQLVDAPLQLEVGALALLQHLPPAALQEIAAVASYQPLWGQQKAGRSLPLASGGELLALVNLEWDAAAALPAEQQALLPPLVSLLSQALANRRAAVDTRFFRGRMTRIIDHANALIFIVDANHRVNFFNHALAELSGLRVEVVLGTDLLRWIPAGEHRRFLRAFERCLSGEWISGFELELSDASGQGAVRAVFNIASLQDQEGQVDQVIAIGQDAASIKLLEKQVLQAEKLATLGRLAAGVMHEINNPLTSVTVYADYLLKKLRRERGEQADLAMLEKILEGSDRILRCTRDLVDYAKPSAARAAPLSLNDVVIQSISFCHHVLESSCAVVTTALAADLSPVAGFRDELQQLLVNLITNAAHAMPAGGGEIVIRTYEVGDGTLALEIRDCGGGIPADKLQRIFQPFFTTKPAGEGTGLGLSIVKKIIEHHEGSILVRSGAGQGTTFLITLPQKPRGGHAV